MSNNLFSQVQILTFWLINTQKMVRTFQLFDVNYTFAPAIIGIFFSVFNKSIPFKHNVNILKPGKCIRKIQDFVCACLLCRRANSFMQFVKVHGRKDRKNCSIMYHTIRDPGVCGLIFFYIIPPIVIFMVFK